MKAHAEIWESLVDEFIDAVEEECNKMVVDCLKDTRDYFKKYATSTHVEVNGSKTWINVFFKDLSMVNISSEDWELIRGW